MAKAYATWIQVFWFILPPVMANFVLVQKHAARKPKATLATNGSSPQAEHFVKPMEKKADVPVFQFVHRRSAQSDNMHSVKTGQAPGSRNCTVTAKFDKYIGEAEYGFVNSSGELVAHMRVEGGYVYKDGPAVVEVLFGLTDPDGDAETSGYTMTSVLELPYGDYDIWLTDSWGDGWVWNDADGSDAMTVEGCLDTPYKLDFMGETSVEGSFTVDPSTGGISGDPHVWFNGSRTTIHLPTDAYTKLLEQGDLALYAKGGAKEQKSMNHIFTIVVVVGGEEAVRVEQLRGLRGKHEALMKVAVDGWTNNFRPGNGKRDLTAALGRLRCNITRERVTVTHESSGLHFTVASRATTLLNATNSHHLNLRFDKGLALSMGSQGNAPATGALPQIWGIEPLAPDVASLIVGRGNRNASKRLAIDEDLELL